MTYKNSGILKLEAKIVAPRFLEEIWQGVDKADALGDNHVSFTLPSNVFLVEELEKELIKSKGIKEVGIQEVNGAYVLTAKWRRSPKGNNNGNS